jgi:dephospho-CoA kinase
VSERVPGAGTRSGRPIRIGITGPIGCGKSQVGRWLADLGVAVVDADAISRSVTAPGHPAHDAVLRRFGPSVTATDGTLDRAALARLVFADPASLRDLEAIVHPAVRPLILEAIDAAERDGAAAVAVEAIKLVEGGLAALCDEVWLVTCDEASQRERLAGRGTGQAEADRRIAAQAGLADRLRPAATRVLETSGTAAATRADVVEALAEAITHAR